MSFNAAFARFVAANTARDILGVFIASVFDDGRREILKRLPATKFGEMVLYLRVLSANPTTIFLGISKTAKRPSCADRLGFVVVLREANLMGLELRFG
jgi:hypothetical protein